MIQPSTLEFLNLLKKNNKREWFEKNRLKYESALDDVHSFLAKLIEASSVFDTSLSGLTPKNTLMRIYRDVRFSKNKEPYKNNFGASLSKGGKKMAFAGYYLHLEPGKSFIAGGMHMPEPDKLFKVRQEISYNTKEFKKIIENKSFKKYFHQMWDGDKLKTAPKGFPKDHPEIELLKFKSYMVTHDFNDKQVLDKNFLKSCLAVFKEIKPLNDFLNRALD